MAASYLILGLAWIAISDRLVALASPDVATHRWIQSTKGAIFVVCSALLLAAVLARAESALRRRRYLLDALVRSSPLAIIAVDFEGDVLLWNARAELLFGWRADEVLGRRLPTIPPDRQSQFEEILERTYRGESVENIELQRLRRDGKVIHVGFANAPLRAADGQIIGAIGMFTDLRQQKEVQRLVRLQAAALQAAPSAIIVTDLDRTILSVNPAFTRITGYSPEEAIGRTPKILRSNPDDRVYEELWDAVASGSEYRGHLVNRRKDGSLYLAELAVAPVVNTAGQVTNFVEVQEDITEATRLTAEVQFLTSFDPLTQLPNRALFLNRSREYTESVQQADLELAVVVAEVENLRQVAQSLGRDAVDAMVREVGQRLERAAGPAAEVSSLGSGCFAIVWPTAAPHDDLPILVRQWVEACEAEIAVREVALHPRLVFGCALFPRHGRSLQDVLTRAEAAVGSALEGSRQFQMFEDHLQTSLDELLALDGDLRRAILEDELFLEYQPIFDLRTGRMAHLEALVRWRHPRHGILAPARFLPVAERTKQMPRLDRWVLQRVARDLQREDFSRFDRIAVNIAADTLEQPDLVACLEELLATNRIPADRYLLEVTEGDAMQDPNASSLVLAALRALGCRVALDDFGVAYSSLNYLRQLPLDFLKLDKSFIRGLGAMSRDERVARTILSLAKDMGLEVIAEGVELPAQLEWLRVHGCEHAQGFFLARPAPVEQLLEGFPATTADPSSRALFVN